MDGNVWLNSDSDKWPRRGDDVVEEVGDGGPREEGATKECVEDEEGVG